MKNLITILLLSTIFICCAQNDESTQDIEGLKPDISTLVDGKGYLYGTVKLLEGNCMPSPGVVNQTCPSTPVKAGVFITKPSRIYESDLLVTNIEANDNGYFELQLDPGEYSVFIYDNLPNWKDWVECGSNTTCDDNGAFSCSGWSGDSTGEIVCSPILITKGEMTEVNRNINHASW